jgi:hypothetical protein
MLHNNKKTEYDIMSVKFSLSISIYLNNLIISDQIPETLKSELYTFNFGLPASYFRLRALNF